MLQKDFVNDRVTEPVGYRTTTRAMKVLLHCPFSFSLPSLNIASVHEIVQVNYK